MDSCKRCSLRRRSGEHHNIWQFIWSRFVRIRRLLLTVVVSCSAHLQSISRSLFKRAIMQSGACVGVAKPLDLNHKYHRSRFSRLTKALSLDHLSSTEKIENLRVVPWEHLIEASVKTENPDGMFCITSDHDLIDGFFQVPKVDDAGKSLIIGNTGHDVLVLDHRQRLNFLGICILRLC